MTQNSVGGSVNTGPHTQFQMQRTQPNGGRSFGRIRSCPAFKNRKRPGRNSTRRTLPARSRNGSIPSCHHRCSVRFAGNNNTIKSAWRSVHALRIQGAMSLYGGLQYTRSPAHDCSSPFSLTVQCRSHFRFSIDDAASTVNLNRSLNTAKSSTVNARSSTSGLDPAYRVCWG